MAFRALNAILVILAIFVAYLQLNDPDPLGWCALYLTWALVALLGATRVNHALLPALLSLTALTWAATLAPALLGRWNVTDLAATMTRDRPEVEVGRELGGLLIVAAHSAAVTVVAWRHARKRIPTPP